MKKLLYLLTSVFLLASIFTSCEKEDKENNTIQGVVTDKETGEPLSSVTIGIAPTEKRVQTAGDGSYILKNLKTGTYIFWAYKDGYEYIEEEVVLMAGKPMQLDIAMEQQPCTIQGVVTDKETGESIPDVTILLQGLDLQAITEQDGSYKLKGLYAGTYIITVKKNGYNEYVSEEMHLDVAQITTLDIALKGEPFEPKEPELQKDYTETAFDMNLEMVYVQGGTFLMGATKEQYYSGYREKPVRRIKLDGYHIGKYEVTQAQWKAVMGTGSSSSFKGDNHPVEKSWEEAQEFCKRLSEATGKKYVLPTEAQWEYVARGGKKSQHYIFAGSNDINEVAWYYDNSGKLGEDHPDYGMHRVGMKKSNELGVYDMTGNVAEWCSDWYGTYEEKDTENPQGPADGEKRVDRGGSWNHYNFWCLVSCRWEPYPGANGFRVAVLP